MTAGLDIFSMASTSSLPKVLRSVMNRQVGVKICCKPASSAVPLMLPQPVHASHPGPAGYPATPLSPLSAGPGDPTMSRNTLEPIAYREGFTNPTLSPIAALITAISPAHSGADALVPSPTDGLPPTVMG